MQAVELPLFGIDEHTKSSKVIAQPRQDTKITHEQILCSTTKVLESYTPHSITHPPQSLEEMFPEQKYEDKDVQKAKQILEEVANQFSPEELKVAVTEIQYLVSTWVDDFEREIFEGKTLRELLHEKGSL